MQPGDVVVTAADTSAHEHWIGFQPQTSVDLESDFQLGIGIFIESDACSFFLNQDYLLIH